jgi:uncharacterized repeat protein (TIGR03803 family)
MKPSALSCFALSACVTAAMLAGCGGSQPPIQAPGAMPRSSAHAPSTSSTNYRVVYSFGALPDGSNPQASLIDVRGTLYGTTSRGGAYTCASGYSCGTIFSVTTGGTEKVLHSFGPRPDGEYPLASLLDAGGTLYGTTAGGGAHPHNGTVFSVSNTGSENVLLSFNGADGRNPAAGLINVNGTFYGTTAGGGLKDCGHALVPSGCGTVFSITPTGNEKALFSFQGGAAGSGWDPVAGLIEASGTLYGTTAQGGRYLSGTVFSITTSGTEKVLHSFGHGADGTSPTAGLIEVKGTFYGTTRHGGAYSAYSCGVDSSCGTVFSITSDGKEKVLHRFGSGADGRNPNAGLIYVKGTFYGTTSGGGALSCGYHITCGTVFSITPDGMETVVHSFNGSDGNNPNAGLIEVKGTLFGTTSDGGTYGNGTVFALTP